MTVIAAMPDDDGFVIGADSAARNVNTFVPGFEKWVFANRYAIAVAGDARTSVLIREHARRNYAKQAFGTQDRVFTLLCELQRIMSDDGYVFATGTDVEDQFRTYGQNLIVLDGETPGVVYMVGADFSYIPIPGFWADGAGRACALGAAHAHFCMGTRDAFDVVRTAVGAAIRWHSQCDGDAFVTRIAYQNGKWCERTRADESVFYLLDR